ncbi:MAG: elongation factor 4 [Candidatus Latescibacterota bacterium]|nr:MAG: elongation factor 4 [Candidatus Latescibacterota bacterium]
MQPNIRNFCIIAHIDHGKSTLADRFLEHTGTLSGKEMQAQVLDSMDLERERGITIKSHAIRMLYRPGDGQEYVLNLIDTPGHVDFSYEVSRSLAACEGAILLVDASQGIEAQTLANLYLALESDLVIVPALNKIDLPGARVDEVSHQIIEVLGCSADDVHHVSAKSGAGVDALLQALLSRVPPPQLERNAPLRGLIFDSLFDQFVGAIAYVRIREGTLRAGERVRFMSTGREFEVQEVGHLRLQRRPCDALHAGEVGYVIPGAKNVADTRVGDTLTTAARPAAEALPGYREVKPMVFSGLYPMDAENYVELRESLEKLVLNDAALQFEPETSVALGFGFRCGFLGLLHMEVIQERLEREYDMRLIATTPNVEYEVVTAAGERIVVDNPARLPQAQEIDWIEEPWVRAEIVLPSDSLGAVMKLAQERRGVHKGMHYLDPRRVELVYELPLAEILFDFYDRLKSSSRGHASFDYAYLEHRRSDLVKLDIALNGDRVDALSIIIHREKAYAWGREMAQKLKELIPRQLFEVAVQACVGSRVIARSTISAMRKNVTAKCYGGDITRKRKLLEKQREGKRRMKRVGSVEVPQEAFLAVLKVR